MYCQTCGIFIGDKPCPRCVGANYAAENQFPPNLNANANTKPVSEAFSEEKYIEKIFEDIENLRKMKNASAYSQTSQIPDHDYYDDDEEFEEDYEVGYEDGWAKGYAAGIHDERENAAPNSGENSGINAGNNFAGFGKTPLVVCLVIIFLLSVFSGSLLSLYLQIRGHI